MAVELIREALMNTFWLCLPLLAVGFVAGIAISLLQIVTSVQDPAFGSVPRLAAFLGALVLFLPWMLVRLCGYATAMLGDFARYAK
ncbi:MAG TPA: flagellar biosynthetic protein FliQ [Bryobacteraceae bacterium]|nr:flagellar biosynthetic protein FliQ [Bryobacteraceae bacterium]